MPLFLTPSKVNTVERGGAATSCRQRGAEEKVALAAAVYDRDAR